MIISLHPCHFSSFVDGLQQDGEAKQRVLLDSAIESGKVRRCGRLAGWRALWNECVWDL